MQSIRFLRRLLAAGLLSMLISGCSQPPGSEFIGQTFTLNGKTVDAQSVNWEDYAGQVVLIDFWATWCGPCRAEQPKLKKLYEDLQHDGFLVVGVCMDQKLDPVKPFEDAHELPWKSVVGPEAWQKALDYDVQFMPRMMLVDRDSRIIASDRGVEEISAEVYDAVRSH